MTKRPHYRRRDHGRIPKSEWIVFPASSHMPHIEETARYLEVVDVFLTRVEQS